MLNGDHLTHPGVQILSIIVGLLVLIWGRKLFWLAVGAMGFMLGLSLATSLLETRSDEWIVLIIGLGAGVVGAILAIFIQKLAIGVAGFLVGGYGLLWLVQSFNLQLGAWALLFFIVGGIGGVIVAMPVLEVALIILSAIIGATLLTEVVNFSPPVTALLFLGLLIFGVIIQSKTWQEKST